MIIIKNYSYNITGIKIIPNKQKRLLNKFINGSFKEIL